MIYCRKADAIRKLKDGIDRREDTARSVISTHIVAHGLPGSGRYGFGEE